MSDDAPRVRDGEGVERITRRMALKQLGVGAAGLMVVDRIPHHLPTDFIVGGNPAEVTIASVSPATVRITMSAIVSRDPTAAGAPAAVPFTGALVTEDVGSVVTRGRTIESIARHDAGDLVVRVTDGPPTIQIETGRGDVVQRLGFSATAHDMSFLLPAGPLLGLGEGGPQFDRKGTVDTMRNGQGGYRLATNGTRAPVQWLVSTDGWAMFIHQPYGSFNFTGPTGTFTPGPFNGAIDLFVVRSADPKVIMREYARITGLPEMPARWTLGYQQSHRTLNGREEILAEARTFREKKLPCDAMIYLGTEFAPSGWNTRNGEFSWHPTNFPDPKVMLDALHAGHFKAIVHIVVEGRTLTGTVKDPCRAPPLPPGRTADDQWPPDRQVSCYWPAHRPLIEAGVDGWWPDQGDGFDGPSRFNRHRMYWEGTQLDRPNERPFALHRNASAGIQRFGGFIWSGDVQSQWSTLATHVPVGINTGLSGLPLWGTDIGGFNPTAEYTGELHVRWFQFGTFCPLFRAHGRNWHLKLPWGWNGGDGGPPESGNFHVAPDELQNATVEPILRKYLELRYQLLPYLYTAVRDAHETGMPIMRALWLHYPDDPLAVKRGDEYLWGSDILVAPVVEKGATTRAIYLPAGSWIDYWTETPVAGAAEVHRPVDLATIPLYVRAGAVIPHGPVRQYADEPSDAPLTLVVYPGADGMSSFYDDDGHTFNNRQGEWMRVTMRWEDASRRLSIQLVPGSRLFPPSPRRLLVRVAGSRTAVEATFTGQPLDLRL